MQSLMFVRYFFLTTIWLFCSAQAESRPETSRIGVLNSQGAPQSIEDAFRNGLRKLSYVEGKNITIEWRRGVGTQKEMRLQAIDLVASKVDLIVSFGSPATRAALDTRATPVVFLVGDPVGAGFAVSLARPGGKGTGVSTQTTELNRKRLEILRQLSPRAQRFLYLGNYSNPIAARDLAEMEKGARALGIKLVSLSAQNSAEIEVELQAIRQRSGDAVVVSADTTLLVNKAKIASAIREAKLPAIFPFREYHEV